MGYPCYLTPFLGLRFFRRGDLFLFDYVFAFSALLPFLIRKIRLGGLGRKGSKRLGLDGHLKHGASCVRLKKIKKACLGLVL